MIEWFGSITGIAGAIWLALNLPSSKWAYPLFLLSSMGLMSWAFILNYPGIFWQQFVFTFINLTGVYRWLYRPMKSNILNRRSCKHSYL